MFWEILTCLYGIVKVFKSMLVSGASFIIYRKEMFWICVTSAKYDLEVYLRLVAELFYMLSLVLLGACVCLRRKIKLTDTEWYFNALRLIVRFLCLAFYSFQKKKFRILVERLI